MTELEYLRGRTRLLETLLTKALPVLRLAALYPTLVGRIEAAINGSPSGELLTREENINGTGRPQADH